MTTEFMECAFCASKPGSPALCESCYHNRNLASQLQLLEKWFDDHASVLAVHNIGGFHLINDAPVVPKTATQNGSTKDVYFAPSIYRVNLRDG